jgi:hypothetical protein
VKSMACWRTALSPEVVGSCSVLSDLHGETWGRRAAVPMESAPTRKTFQGTSPQVSLRRRRVDSALMEGEATAHTAGIAGLVVVRVVDAERERAMSALLTTLLASQGALGAATSVPQWARPSEGVWLQHEESQSAGRLVPHLCLTLSWLRSSTAVALLLLHSHQAESGWRAAG